MQKNSKIETYHTNTQEQLGTHSLSAVGYARYSTDMQTENSIEYQTAAIKKYCDENNITLLKVFTDEALSGTNTDRPGFQAMVHAAKSKLFDAVIIYDITRGSRNVADWFKLREEMMRLGIRVISTSQKLGDITNPSDFLVELINVGMGQHMVLETRQKSIAGKTEAAKRATFQGGRPPLGYDIKNQIYVINPIEAEIVKIIFNMYANDSSYGDILEALKGKCTKSGGSFGKNSLQSILKNERYIGVYTWNKYTEKIFRKWAGRRSNPNEVRIENAIPPIIDKNTWDKVQARLRNHKTRGRYKAKRAYLLSGLIHCNDCESLYVGFCSTNKKGYETRYYACGRKYRTKDCKPKNINANFIEEFTIDAVKDFLGKTDFSAVSELIAKECRNIDNDVTHEMAELARINKEIQNGVKSILNGFDFPELRSEIDRLKSRKFELEQKIAEKKSFTENFLSVDVITKDLQQSLKAAENNNIQYLISRHVQKINAYADGSFTVYVGVDANGCEGWT
jgi:site-specific DNA recombinase